MDTPPASAEPPRARRWSGPAAWLAVAVFVAGRLAVEPLRDVPHFDSVGMEGYGATEVYQLRKNPEPVEIAFFGSSESVWAILSEDVARDLGENPARVRNLATSGGTPYDIWNIIRRNPEKLASLRVAVIEVNPFVFKQGLDSDPRVAVDISQHGTMEERQMLSHRSDRIWQMAEWVLPLTSVRRSLQTAFLNVVDPDPGCAVFPEPEQRIYPAVGWKVDGHRHMTKRRQTISPRVAAQRLVGNWRLSRLQDASFRRSLDWLAAHHVRIIFQELPVHPEVVKAVRADPLLEQGHASFLAYLDTLERKPEASIFTPDPADCGIAAEHMADRTHVNELGAHLYSHYIAAKLRPLLSQTR